MMRAMRIGFSKASMTGAMMRFLLWAWAFALVSAKRPEYSAFVKAFEGECADSRQLLMYVGGGDNPGGNDDDMLAFHCSKACLDRKYPLSGSWFGFEAAGFVVRSSRDSVSFGRCACDSAASITCARTSDDSNCRFDFTCDSQNRLPCTFGGCVFSKGLQAKDMARACGTDGESPCPASISSNLRAAMLTSNGEQAALALDGDDSSFFHTLCSDQGVPQWWRGKKDS